MWRWPYRHVDDWRTRGVFVACLGLCRGAKTQRGSAVKVVKVVKIGGACARDNSCVYELVKHEDNTCMHMWERGSYVRNRLDI
jgi:hypothetical protein